MLYLRKLFRPATAPGSFLSICFVRRIRSFRWLLAAAYLGSLSHGIAAPPENADTDIAASTPSAVFPMPARAGGDVSYLAPRRVVAETASHNLHSHRFLYAPAIEIPAAEGARLYTVRLVDSNGKTIEVASDENVVSLSSVWDELAVGFVRAVATSEPESGSRKDCADCPGYFMSFFKATSFDAAHVRPPRKPWLETVDEIYEYLTTFEQGESHDPELPAFFWHAATDARTGELTPRAYPGLHYPNYLRFFTKYAQLRPERAEEANRIAALVAAKSREFVTPSDFAWPGMPYTTIQQGEMGGGHEAGLIQPLKGALLGSALFDYADEVGDEEALDFALHIGRVLAERQRASGGLPMRVNAETDRDEEGGESTNLIFAVDLWERLERVRPGEFAAARDSALRWLFENPMKDQQWIASFEDVATDETGSGSTNYNHNDATAMALYLLENQARDGGYLPLARSIERWIEEGFVFYAAEHPVDFMDYPVPAVMEQSVHYYPIDSHLARNALLQLTFYRATGERVFLDKARAMGNALTHYLNDQGEPLTYAPDPELGYGYSNLIWFACAANTGLSIMMLEEETREEEKL